MANKHHGSVDITHTILSVLFIGLLIASCFWILRPFLFSLVWAAIIVIATWPILQRLQARVANRRGIAVAVMGVTMLFIILVPVFSAVRIIVGNVKNITQQARILTSEPLPPPPDWLKRAPVVGETLAEHWRTFASHNPAERSARLTARAKEALQWFAANAGGIGATMLQLLLTVIIAIILYAKGEVAREGILRFSRRLAGIRGEEVTVLAAKAVRAVVLGVVVTALIQTTLGGIGLLVAGVPAVSLLMAVMLILCLAQLGPVLVLLPAVIWVYWSGRPVAGTALLIIGIIAGTIDNVIRPVLIKKEVDLPLLLIFAGVIGGLVAFGIVGLFIGPVMLAVGYTLLKAWVSGIALEEVASENDDRPFLEE
jgi:predicted PurR-regulated permease PerM